MPRITIEINNRLFRELKAQAEKIKAHGDYERPDDAFIVSVVESIENKDTVIKLRI